MMRMLGTPSAHGMDTFVFAHPILITSCIRGAFFAAPNATAGAWRQRSEHEGYCYPACQGDAASTVAAPGWGTKSDAGPICAERIESRGS